MIATESVWKYTAKIQVGEIITRNYESFNSDDAAREILKISSGRWGKNTINGLNAVVGVVYISKEWIEQDRNLSQTGQIATNIRRSVVL